MLFLGILTKIHFFRTLEKIWFLEFLTAAKCLSTLVDGLLCRKTIDLGKQVMIFRKPKSSTASGCQRDPKVKTNTNPQTFHRYCYDHSDYVRPKRGVSDLTQLNIRITQHDLLGIWGDGENCRNLQIIHRYFYDYQETVSLYHITEQDVARVRLGMQNTHEDHNISSPSHRNYHLLSI